MSEGIRVLPIDHHRMFAEGLTMLLAGEPGIAVVGRPGSAEAAVDLSRPATSRGRRRPPN